MDHTKRVSLDGHHSHDLLQKSLSLKYPEHKHHFNNESVNEIQRKYTQVAKNYDHQLKYMKKFHDAERRLEIIADLNR